REYSTCRSPPLQQPDPTHALPVERVPVRWRHRWRFLLPGLPPWPTAIDRQVHLQRTGDPPRRFDLVDRPATNPLAITSKSLASFLGKGPEQTEEWQRLFRRLQ